eukprot:gene16081-7432_t
MDECKNLLSCLQDALKSEQFDAVNRIKLVAIDVLEKGRRAYFRGPMDENLIDSFADLQLTDGGESERGHGLRPIR